MAALIAARLGPDVLEGDSIGLLFSRAGADELAGERRACAIADHAFEAGVRLKNDALEQAPHGLPGDVERAVAGEAKLDLDAPAEVIWLLQPELPLRIRFRLIAGDIGPRIDEHARERRAGFIHDLAFEIPDLAPPPAMRR